MQVCFSVCVFPVLSLHYLVILFCGSRQSTLMVLYCLLEKEKREKRKIEKVIEASTANQGMDQILVKQQSYGNKLRSKVLSF